MDLIRFDSILSGKQVVVGSSDSPLILANKGGVYFQYGTQYKKIGGGGSGSGGSETPVIKSGIAAYQPGEVKDWYFYYDPVQDQLKLAAEDRFILIATQSTLNNYIKKDGDTVTGVLTFSRPFEMETPELVRNLNAQFFQGMEPSAFLHPSVDFPTSYSNLFIDSLTVDSINGTPYDPIEYPIPLIGWDAQVGMLPNTSDAPVCESEGAEEEESGEDDTATEEEDGEDDSVLITALAKDDHLYLGEQPANTWCWWPGSDNNADQKSLVGWSEKAYDQTYFHGTSAVSFDFLSPYGLFASDGQIKYYDDNCNPQNLGVEAGQWEALRNKLLAGEESWNNTPVTKEQFNSKNADGSFTDSAKEEARGLWAQFEQARTSTAVVPQRFHFFCTWGAYGGYHFGRYYVRRREDQGNLQHTLVKYMELFKYDVVHLNDDAGTATQWFDLEHIVCKIIERCVFKELKVWMKAYWENLGTIMGDLQGLTVDTTNAINSIRTQIGQANDTANSLRAHLTTINTQLTAAATALGTLSNQIKNLFVTNADGTVAIANTAPAACNTMATQFTSVKTAMTNIATQVQNIRTRETNIRANLDNINTALAAYIYNATAANDKNTIHGVTDQIRKDTRTFVTDFYSTWDD